MPNLYLVTTSENLSVPLRETLEQEQKYTKYIHFKEPWLIIFPWKEDIPEIIFHLV